MIWQVAREVRPSGVHLRLETEAGATSRGDAIRALVHDGDFRQRLIDEIVGAPFDAIYWETPPISRGGLERPFECRLLDAPSLARGIADPTPFAGPLAKASRRGQVAVFPNLGGDAILVVPVPTPATAGCAHLASFLRAATPDQAHALLRAVGEAVLRAMDDEPLWISTAGGGVAWTHVRLDRAPKYYSHEPYRRPGA